MLSETMLRVNETPPLTKHERIGSQMAYDTLFENLPSIKSCRRCGESKPIFDYSFDSRNNRYVSACKRCHADMNRDYVRKNPEKVRISQAKTRKKNPEVYRAKARRWVDKNREQARSSNRRCARNRLLRSLNMTMEDLNLAYDRQNGACAICEIKIDLNGGKHIHIDHCHETNRFRGILCIGCNTSLGKFGDNPNMLMKAANYLLSAKH